MDERREVRRDRRFLVVGADARAVRLALELADAALPVTLATRGFLSPLPGGALGSTLYEEVPLLLALRNHPGVEVIEQAELLALAADETGLHATIRQRPQPVDTGRCTSCGACVPVCPVDLPATPEAPSRRALSLPPAELGPGGARIEAEGRPPCRAACPIGVNAQGYVALIAKGRFAEALALVRERNPLPGICGRVCTHPCESACRRGEIDDPVAICALKRFVADRELSDRAPFRHEPAAADRPERVAVVGSGPAGLAAAYDLRRRGYPVTVFEALPVAGGLLRTGIPAYRLPREILDYEIGLIAGLGVEIRTGVPIGADLSIDDLFRDGYRAVVVATGAPRDRGLDVPGASLQGIHGCLSFLRAVNLGEAVAVGSRVVVVGGGNSAIDAARAALRLGAREVSVVYRRGPEEMPALPEEVAAARAEGVVFRFLEGPVAVLGEGGVNAVRCVTMTLGEPDASGRRSPVPLEGSEHDLPAETVIFALGQEADTAAFAGAAGVSHEGGRIRADARAATSRFGVFAAGDAVRGPESVIRAMADGQLAALAAHEFLSGEPLAWPDWTRTDYDRSRPPRGGFAPAARRRPPHLHPSTPSSGSFDEVEHAFAEVDAVAEASRCLQCGACSRCGACVKACGEARAIDLEWRPERRVLELCGAIRTDSDEEIAAGTGLLLYDARESAAPPPDAAPILEHCRPEVREPEPLQRAALTAQGTSTAVFLCTCNETIRHRGILDSLAAGIARHAGVASVEIVNAACQREGAERMSARLLSGGCDRLLLAACLCCPLEIVCGSCTHQRVRAKRLLLGGLGIPLHRLEALNLRDEVLNQPGLDGAQALELGGRLIRTALARSLAAVVEPGTATIAPALCRACGTCVACCPQEAISLRPRPGGIRLAHIDTTACTLCGRCLAVCPTGAPDEPFAGQRQIREALSAALSEGER